MKRRNLLRRSSLLFSLVVILLLSVASWFAFNAIVWRLPAQPGTYALALAELDGGGRFVDSGQRLGNFRSSSVVLYDFDGNGTVDVIAA